MNAAVQRHSRPRQLFLLFALICALLVACAACARAREAADECAARTRAALAEQITANISKCARIQIKMTYAGADIEHSLYPELKPLLYAVEELNSACASALGEAYAPVESALIKKLRNTCTVLESRYAAGQPPEDAEQALVDYLAQFDDILSARFSSAEGILPAGTNRGR